MKFKIVNGIICDPSQKINYKRQDIYVKDGIIVKPSSSEMIEYKTTYNVEGMVVMAGGIDIHRSKFLLLH